MVAHMPPPQDGAPDNVARWQEIQRTAYHEARFSFTEGWFYGALHDDDLIERSTDLGRLLDKLLERESVIAAERDRQDEHSRPEAP